MDDVYVPERAALVVNTSSRTGAAAFESARARLGELGVPLVACFPVNDPTRLAEVVEHAAADGCDLVIVGGGDGTLSTAVDHLAGGRAVLGLLPLGTANDLARTLQVPTDVRTACDVIADGNVVDIDLGRVGDDYFVNVASIGLSVGVAHALTPRLKRRLGPLAYPVATLRAYRTHEPFTAWLEFPDGDHAPLRVDDSLQVAVGNGRFYGGGNAVSPTAGIDDHALDVYAARGGSLRDLARMARLLRTGAFVEHENVVHLTTRRVLVRTEPVQGVNVDGEVVATTPQEIGVHRNAVNVLTPRTSAAARQDGSAPSAARRRVGPTGR